MAAAPPEVLPGVFVARDTTACDLAWLAEHGIRALVPCGGARVFYERLLDVVACTDTANVARVITDAACAGGQYNAVVYSHDLAACGACVLAYLVRDGTPLTDALVQVVGAMPACLPSKDALHALGVLEIEVHGAASVRSHHDVTAVANAVRAERQQKVGKRRCTAAGRVQTGEGSAVLPTATGHVPPPNGGGGRVSGDAAKAQLPQRIHGGRGGDRSGDDGNDDVVMQQVVEEDDDGEAGVMPQPPPFARVLNQFNASAGSTGAGVKREEAGPSRLLHRDATATGDDADDQPPPFVHLLQQFNARVNGGPDVARAGLPQKAWDKKSSAEDDEDGQPPPFVHLLNQFNTHGTSGASTARVGANTAAARKGTGTADGDEGDQPPPFIHLLNQFNTHGTAGTPAPAAAVEDASRHGGPAPAPAGGARGAAADVDAATAPRSELANNSAPTARECNGDTARDDGDDHDVDVPPSTSTPAERAAAFAEGTAVVRRWATAAQADAAATAVASATGAAAAWGRRIAHAVRDMLVANAGHGDAAVVHAVRLGMCVGFAKQPDMAGAVGEHLVGVAAEAVAEPVCEPVGVAAAGMLAPPGTAAAAAATAVLCAHCFHGPALTAFDAAVAATCARRFHPAAPACDERNAAASRAVGSVIATLAGGGASDADVGWALAPLTPPVTVTATTAFRSSDGSGAAAVHARTGGTPHAALIQRLTAIAEPFAGGGGGAGKDAPQVVAAAAAGTATAAARDVHVRLLPAAVWEPHAAACTWRLPGVLGAVWVRAAARLQHHHHHPGATPAGAHPKKLSLLPYYGTVHVVYNFGHADARVDGTGANERSQAAAVADAAVDRAAATQIREQTTLVLPTPAASILLHFDGDTDALPLADLKAAVSTMPPAIFAAALRVLTTKTPAGTPPLLRVRPAPSGRVVVLNAGFRTRRGKVVYTEVMET